MAESKKVVMAVGSGDVTATVEPSNATNKAVEWSVLPDDGSIVTISASGETCTVTAVAAGSATVTATTEDGGHTADCTVTVTGGS
ncbi:Ig domain-containing protein [Endozoicomonas sp. ONNA1]|uniref:Ig-like domain-containing protein n=1 Tax=Endozoicomonas sp. ONNA1 TaxID=2828740 RepID=UPI002149222E|nr:Ig-like domain-containing protein [Endozoicomonas sp. ONNA1]